MKRTNSSIKIKRITNFVAYKQLTELGNNEYNKYDIENGFVITKNLTCLSRSHLFINNIIPVESLKDRPTGIRY